MQKQKHKNFAEDLKQAKSLEQKQDQEQEQASHERWLKAYYEAAECMAFGHAEYHYKYEEFIPDDAQLRDELKNLEPSFEKGHPIWTFHELHAGYVAATKFDPTAEKKARRWMYNNWPHAKDCLRALKNPDPKPWLMMTQRFIERNWLIVKLIATKLFYSNGDVPYEESDWRYLPPDSERLEILADLACLQ